MSEQPPKRAVQLVFDLPHRTARGRAEFFVSQSNRDAIALIERWPDWPHRVIAVAGPEGSGKTHLASVWQEKSEARIVSPRDLDTDLALPRQGWALAIDDAQSLSNELALFHLINRSLAGEGWILLTGRELPARWKVALPDLRTRLTAVPVAALGRPDDQLLAVVLLKLFTDRQLKLDDRVVPFLVTRLSRSLAAVVQAVAALDAASLERGVAITPKFAAEILRLEEDTQSD
jgi:chromosomal replication initiation ATPase DnaA